MRARWAQGLCQGPEERPNRRTGEWVTGRRPPAPAGGRTRRSSTRPEARRRPGLSQAQPPAEPVAVNKSLRTQATSPGHSFQLHHDPESRLAPSPNPPPRRRTHSSGTQAPHSHTVRLVWRGPCPAIQVIQPVREPFAASVWNWKPPKSLKRARGFSASQSPAGDGGAPSVPARARETKHVSECCQMRSCTVS